MTDYEYIRRRLQRMMNEGLLEVRAAIEKTDAQSVRSGASGEIVHGWLQEAVGKVFKAALIRMSTLTFEASDRVISAEGAQAIESAGLELVSNVTSVLDEKYRNQGYKSPPPVVSKLEAALRESVRHAVDDFQHGMAGDVPLKRDPLVSVISNITNSPNAIAQTAVGDHNQQSVQQQVSAIWQAIDDMLASDEFKRLDGDRRDAVQDTADAMRDEIAKPSADMSKVRRWANRLLELVREFGMHVAATALAKVVLG